MLGVTDEATFKRLFKKSVRSQGGLAISLSSNIYSGLPDLVVMLPNMRSVFIEAKYLRDVGDVFERKILYSPEQSRFMYECNSISPGSGFGLVGFHHQGKLTASLVPYRYDKIDSNYRDYTGFSRIVSDDKFFDVTTMFKYLDLKDVRRALKD
jgi:hypothetical protein